jgi:hypothetical protein
MLSGKENELSCLGIQGRHPLLVHQWNALRGKSSAELAFKNEDLPFVQSHELAVGIEIVCL